MTTPNKRHTRRAQTLERVLTAAREAFETEGYEASTVRSIARRMGMSTGAINSLYDGKEELYRAVYGHAPINPQQGRQLLAIARSLALNGRQLRAEEPFGGALARLIAIARGRVAQIWPEGLRSDLTSEPVVETEKALAELDSIRDIILERPVVNSGGVHLTAAGLLEYARRCEADDPAFAAALRDRAEARCEGARERLRARGFDL